MNPIPHLDIELSGFESQIRFDISRVIHFPLLAADICTHLSDKDGCVARACARATQDLLGVVMRDHVTDYSKGNTDTARMMTPFLASKLFDSNQSNPTTIFCPSLNVQGHCAAASSTVWTLRGHHVWTVGAFPSAH